MMYPRLYARVRQVDADQQAGFSVSYKDAGLILAWIIHEEA